MEKKSNINVVSEIKETGPTRECEDNTDKKLENEIKINYIDERKEFNDINSKIINFNKNEESLENNVLNMANL